MSIFFFCQISDMVLEKKEEVTALDMRLQALDKDLVWKKEVTTFFCNEGF